MVSSGAVTLCLDARILTEYAEVLARPRFSFDPDGVAALLAYLRDAGWMIAAEPLSTRLPDPDDEPFLEVAASGLVEFLVTGNTAHFSHELCGDVVVMMPGEFIELYRAAGRDVCP